MSSKHSSKISEHQLNELVRLVVRMFVNEVKSVEEMSTSAAAGPISTPMAFSKRKVKEDEEPERLKGRFLNRGEIQLEGGLDPETAFKIANYHWDIFGSLGADERGVYNFKTRGDRFCCAVGTYHGKPAILSVTTTPGRLQLLVGDEAYPADSQNINEMDGWESPTIKTYNNVVDWEKDNIHPTNHTYIGEPLHNYGFQYKIGQIIPRDVGFRRLAMRNWNDAKAMRNKNLSLGKPSGINESRKVLMNGKLVVLTESVAPEYPFSEKQIKVLSEYFEKNQDVSFDLVAESMSKTLGKKISSKQLYKLYVESLMGKSMNENFSSRDTIYKDRQGGQDVYWIDNRDRGGKIFIKPENIQKYLRKGYELVDLQDADRVDEMTTTGDVSGYNVPSAFARKGGSKKGVEGSAALGYELTPIGQKEMQRTGDKLL